MHKLGGNKVFNMIEEAEQDKEHLYIIQEFKQPKKVEMAYVDEKYVYKQMSAKIRITPYFSFSGKNKGELIAAKVTGCNSSEYIHAGTGSINAPISNDYTK